MLVLIFSKDKTKYVYQILSLKQMILYYFLEMCKMDVEMAKFLEEKKTIGPCDQLDGIECMKDSQIQQDP